MAVGGEKDKWDVLKAQDRMHLDTGATGGWKAARTRTLESVRYGVAQAFKPVG